MRFQLVQGFCTFGRKEMARKKPCAWPICRRYEMTQREFRRLRGELWDASFISRFGKLAAKLYRQLYKRDPKPRRSRWSTRADVFLYPCGILEQAYEQLTGAGVPLIKPDSALARGIAKFKEERALERYLHEREAARRKNEIAVGMEGGSVQSTPHKPVNNAD
jgi:hypothetical protein